MKLYGNLPMGAVLLALGLGLSSVVPATASARDEESGTRAERGYLRIAQEDRDNDRDSNSGYLGVQVQRLSAALRRAKGIPESTEGTLVSSVEDGSPADEAGIKRGDVILQVNRQSTPDPGDLVQTVRNLDPGRRIPVQIWRDGVTRTFTLTVGTRPERPDMPMPPPGGWGDRDDSSRDMPGEPRMQILRRNRDDLERQIKDLQDQLQRLEREIQQLRSDMNKQHMDRRDRDRDDDRDRSDDRDRNDDGD